MNSATGETFKNFGQTLCELVRIQNIEVFIKELIKAPTHFVESRLFRKEHFEFSNAFLKFRSSPWSNEQLKLLLLFHQITKAQKQSYLSVSLKIPWDLLRRPINLCQQSIKLYYDSFHKICCRNGREKDAFYRSWPWVKVEWTCGNGVNTASMGSIGWIWLLVWGTLRFPRETLMHSFEAVRTMPYVVGCHTLSKPFGDAIPKISDGKTSRYIFSASLIGAILEEKTINWTKKLLEIYLDYWQIVNATTRIKKIRFR